MNAGRLETRPIAHDGSLFMNRTQRKALVRELFPDHKLRKIADVMLKFVQVAVQRTIKSEFLTMVNKRRFGMGPRTALSMDNDVDPAEKVNDLISTLVRLYRAKVPLLSVEF